MGRQIQYLYYNSKCNDQLKKILKNFFDKTYNNETEKHHSGIELKIIHFVQSYPPDVKNFN